MILMCFLINMCMSWLLLTLILSMHSSTMKLIYSSVYPCAFLCGYFLIGHRDICIPCGGRKYIFGMGKRTSTRHEQWKYYMIFAHNLLSAISLPTFAARLI